MAKTKLIIAGAGGLGRELVSLVTACNDILPTYHLLGFLAPDEQGRQVGGYPILGDEAWAADTLPRDVKFVLGVGHPPLRTQIADQLEKVGFTPASLIHPSAIIGERNHLASGTVITAGCTLTVDIALESHVLINLHCTLGHDVTIGRGSILAPGVHVSGQATIGEAVEIGTGAVILPGKRVGNSARLGAGAVLTKDLPAHQTWIGVPARPLPPNTSLL